MNEDFLSDEEKVNLSVLFENAPRLAEAYRLKNLFLEIMHTKNASETAAKKLSDWFMAAEKAAFRKENPLQEFKPCITAYHNWSDKILNVPYSNGFTEGCNNKTKVLKRVCLGFRNFERFRSRILHCAS